MLNWARKRILIFGAVATSAAWAVFGVGMSAHADSPPQLSSEQKATIAELNTPYTVTRAAPQIVHSASAGVQKGRLELHRGGALMWARDAMDWYYTGSSIISSSLQQEAGFVFPNTSKAKGVKRYYASKTQHDWRGNYTIGAGVVTKWGAVRLYSEDYSTDWQVYKDGAGRGVWNH